MRLDELAATLKLSYEGEPATGIDGLCSVDEPRPGHLGFALNVRNFRRFAEAGCPMTLLARQEWRRELADEAVTASGLSFLFSENPYESFVDAMALVRPEPAPSAGIHLTAVIDSDARIGGDVRIEAHAVIGPGAVIGDRARIGPSCLIEEGVHIGADSRLDANVVVYRRCRIGRECWLYANCVVGADGFGHLPRPDGGWRRIPHMGIVDIGDKVRIGAGTTIDRAVVDATVVESGGKLDNLIHIGHNARIGENTAMAAGGLVSGHARIGKRCRIAGNVSFAGVEIADDTTVLGATSISKNISEPGTTVLGYMGFMPVRRWRRWLAFLHRLESRGSGRSE